MTVIAVINAYSGYASYSCLLHAALALRRQGQCDVTCCTILIHIQKLYLLVYDVPVLYPYLWCTVLVPPPPPLLCAAKASEV